MQFHLKKLALTLGLCVFGTCVLAQQSSKATSAAAEPTTKPATQETKQSLFKAQHFDQAAISPDGKRVAWVEIRADDDGAPTGKQDIFLQDVSAPGKPMRVTAGAPTAHFNEGNVAWSPDSKQIAFISDAVKSGQPQLYVSSASGGPVHKLTSVKGFLAGPKWSPDGKSVAVLFTENATREAGPLVAETPETGEIKDAFFEQRLAIVDAASCNLRQVTPADTYIYEYDWAPDGNSIVLTAAKGNGDSNWYIAELFAVNVASAEMQSLYKPKLQIAHPAISPDGQSIAFIEGLMSDEDSVGGDVFLISRSGGAPRNLTPERKASAVVVAWTSDAKIIDMENVDGESSVARIDPGSGRIDSLFHAPELLTSGFWSTSLSLTPDGKTAAFVRSSFQDPPEVWAGPMGMWKQVTHRNEGIKAEWGDAKSLHWKNDGFSVQGWLIYPKNFDAAKKYPLVVCVHGGPGDGVQPNWPSAHAYEMALPEHGYFLLLPNPRGSFGEGEAFTRANVRDFGYGDWRDVMAGVDEAIRVAPIDPQRLGLTGWSYGGYMTMWGVTQTDRFRAAMAGAGIANWSSYYGENKIDQWMIPFFGKSVYDDPEVYARSAPLTFIKKVKTPTLVIVGDSDGECPTPQSYEFWHALKTLGVKTELVVYEREGHMFMKPEHLRDVMSRTVDWFDEYLK
ncbi:MAG TPA: S9 family peptidase [Candidatus Acidoferrales bacterium]|jgi:dipeptidyl aminopeptidase/acylaminoacyl peptidase|nr:S9 family peptidase [Candidatus Acidoferrales bacterium]